MSKSFPEWWKNGQKVRTANDGVLTLNIAEDSEYWLTNNAGKEVSVFSMDILGPASVPEACRMTTDITELAQSLKRRATYANEFGESLYVKADDVLALVEALEKAQQRIAELDIKNCELDSLTQRWAVERAENADRIAELELSTVPGKWIPVSEQKPDCWCLTCRPVVLNDMRFVVCPDCGNKRCPRANNHRNACTGSNEPGQDGSAYPAAPQSPGSEPATVPGKWIPVSERLPEAGVKVLCFPVEDEPIHATFNGQLWLQDVSWSASYEPIDNVIPITVTHWMPLPAAPQEVK